MVQKFKQIKMARKIRRDRLHRADPKGNLYYVRLNTEYGIFYKIGFTTFGSVEARMSYGGSTDWQYIDKVLMFKNLPDAFEVEQKLHTYLDKKKPLRSIVQIKSFLCVGMGKQSCI